MEKENTHKVNSKSYFIYLIIILMFVEILDTYTTNFPNVIPSLIIEEFLSDYPSNVAKSIFALSLAIATIGMYFVFLNQYLADRVGRKIVLALTVFGMGFASLLLSLSTNIVEYTIYLFLLYVFFSSDIWTIYITEECPSDKRAFWTNIVLVGGVVGALLIPVFRSYYINETSSNWRGMTYFAIILGFTLCIIIFLTFKETSTFEKTKELTSSNPKKQNLFKENFRTLFKSSHRTEYIVILLMSFLIGLNYIFISLGQSYIADSPNLNENDINLIVLVMGLSVISGYFITGIIADKYGRKPLMYLYTCLLPLAIAIVVFGSQSAENALLYVCIGAGLANVAYWGLGILVRIVTLEIIPTDARGTGSGFKSLIGALGITTGLITTSVIALYFNYGVAFIVFSILLLLNVPLILLYLKETKGVDISEIKNL